MKKNVASQFVGTQMLNAADGTPFTGSASVFVTLDNGSQSPGGGSVTHKGNGYHVYAPTQGETNGDFVAFTFTGTGAMAVTVQLETEAPVVEGTYTPIQWLRLMGAVLLGKASGMASGTGTFRDTGDSTNRVVATQDADGNRSVVTLDPS